MCYNVRRITADTYLIVWKPTVGVIRAAMLNSVGRVKTLLDKEA